MAIDVLTFTIKQGLAHLLQVSHAETMFPRVPIKDPQSFLVVVARDESHPLDQQSRKFIASHLAQQTSSFVEFSIPYRWEGTARLPEVTLRFLCCPRWVASRFLFIFADKSVIAIRIPDRSEYASRIAAQVVLSGPGETAGEFGIPAGDVEGI